MPEAQRALAQQAAAIDRQLEYAQSQLMPRQGELKLTWLLNSVDDKEWILRTPHTRKSQGQWKGVVRINWSVLLPDGSLLTDQSNSRLLEAVKRLCIISMNPDAMQMSRSLAHFVSDILNIVKWMIVHKQIYQPHKFGFKLLDANAVRSFMSEYVNGGSSEALGHFRTLIRHFYQNVPDLKFSEEFLISPYAIPKADIDRITTWLQEQNFYVKPPSARKITNCYISRTKIARLLNVDAQCLSTEKITAFLRKFEPDLWRKSPDLLVPISRISTECYSHNSRLISEVISTPISASSCLTTLTSWEQIFKVHRHFPNDFPSSNGVKFRQIRQDVIAAAAPIGTTPWIPLKTALTYTNESIRIIHCYGEALVSFYLKAIDHFNSHDLLRQDGDSGCATERNRAARNAWVNKHLPKVLKPLHIDGWTSRFTYGGSNPYHEFRERPALTDAISLLIGSVVVLTSTLKPLRSDELASLSRECVFFREDGYYLLKKREKQGVENQLDEFLRPIPRIVAKGLGLLKDIGDGLKSASGETEEYALQALMYFSGLQETASLSCGVVNEKFLLNCIDRFCDWVNLPPDAYGRRWYYRTHEGRKSFLITFFWCFKYSSLGAASWIAEHKTWQDTLAYIEANFPGEELPEFEAQYASEQLWQFENNSQTEVTNINDLYQSVCKHFRVTQINLIRHKDLTQWLKIAFRENIYQISAIVIGNANRKTSVKIAFRIKQDQDADERKRAP